MPFETLADDFARALADPSLAPPSDTRGRADRPDRRRFAVYRNNVAAGLGKSLEARYPVTRRLVGDEFFRGMASAFVGDHKPRTPVMIHYGADFPDFIAAFAPAADLPYLAEVAALENAWIEAYHAADAPALAVDALAQAPPERLASIVLVFHPAMRLLRFAHPAASIWAAHQGPGEPLSPDVWSGEDALVTRPEAQVHVRRLLESGGDFIAALLQGAPLGQAAAALVEAGQDFGAHVVGLFEAGAVTGWRLQEN